MIKIPGFRYDATIKNYVPILHDTPENRAFNLVTASNIIKYDNLNTIKYQIKSSQKNIFKLRKHVYPNLCGSVINLYNVNRHQQTGTHDIKNKKFLSMKRMHFSCLVNVEVDEDDELNTYHNIYKCFPPDLKSQIVMSSYSSSPFSVHHSLFKLNYSEYHSGEPLQSHSNLIKRFDSLGGVKLSVDMKKIVLLSKKEFCMIDKENYNEISSKFTRELPSEMRCAFDASDKLLIGVHSKKGMTYLASYDLLSNGARYESRKCDWERKWVFSDIVYDINGANVFLSLRGRMNNSSECILQHDFRCPIPSQKNIRRLSLNFHQNSSVNLTKVPNYSDLIVTHCYDGRCALWDMRWKNRPAVTYQNISPGKPGVPIDIDPSSQFVTMTDNDNIIRIFNLKTGLILYSEQQTFDNNSANHVFSFYNQTGLHCRPTLVSNFSPNVTHVRHLTF